MLVPHTPQKISIKLLDIICNILNATRVLNSVLAEEGNYVIFNIM